MLDTIIGEAGGRLYQRAGWTRVGETADYAATPYGPPGTSRIYAKRLA